MSKDIINYNSKRQLHGYNERYWDDGKLLYKGFFNNGDEIDYSEWYYYTCELEKCFYI